MYYPPKIPSTPHPPPPAINYDWSLHILKVTTLAPYSAAVLVNWK